jgi:hypothetical protein
MSQPAQLFLLSVQALWVAPAAFACTGNNFYEHPIEHYTKATPDSGFGKKSCIAGLLIIESTGKCS